MTTGATSLAVDPRGLERLRSQAGASPEKALREAAKQFEVLFVNMLLKSMRQAAPQDGPLDSEQTRMYTGMLDQQLAQAMANRGIGLAEVMAKQLSKGSTSPVDSAATPGVGGASRIRESSDATPRTGAGAPAPAADPSSVTPPVGPTVKARDFINKLWPHAVEAGKATGLPPHFIIGQAALESGWGARDIKAADGSPTYNLFGVKAGRSWGGETAAAKTTEFVSGVKQKVVETFRSYSSYAEAFMDYANLLKSNPRYSAVLEAGNDPKAFAQGLQKAGYATDPAYAAKLQRVITGSVMRQGLSA
jgi:flagellar protein FlgJ